MSKKFSTRCTYLLMVFFVALYVNVNAQCGSPLDNVAVVGRGLNFFPSSTYYALIDWEPTSDQDYEIRYRQVGASTWRVEASTVSSYRISGLAGGRYEFQVRHKCSPGSQQGWSPIQVFSTTFSTCAPQIPSVVVDDRYVGSVTAYVKWNTVFNATYEVSYRKRTDSEWGQPIATREQSILLTNLDPNTAYAVRVRSKCASNEFSLWSNAAYFSTDGCTVLSLNASTYEGAVLLFWDEIDYAIDLQEYDGRSSNNGEVIYLVEYNRIGGPLLESKEINTSQFIIPAGSLSHGREYEFRARKKCGAAWGEWSRVTFRYKAEPTRVEIISLNGREQTAYSQGEETNVMQEEKIYIERIINLQGNNVLPKVEMVEVENDPANAVKNLQPGLYLIEYRCNNEYFQKKVMKVD